MYIDTYTYIYIYIYIIYICRYVYVFVRVCVCHPAIRRRRSLLTNTRSATHLRPACTFLTKDKTTRYQARHHPPTPEETDGKPPDWTGVGAHQDSHHYRRILAFHGTHSARSAPQKALCGGIPSSFLEPSPRSWSHFVGIYRQNLTRSLEN